MYTKLLQDLSSRNYIALMLIVALLSWSVALPTLLRAQHDDVSPGPLELQNILSDSAPGMTATHTISFKIATGTTATVDHQVTITYQAEGGSNFDANSVSIVSATVAGGSGTLAINAPSSNATTLVFDITGALVAEDVVTIVAEGIVNPNHTFAESDPLNAVTHLVTFSVSGNTGTDVYSNDTRVAIIPAVTMTAAVDTLFTFSVAGLANAVTINGTPTTGSSTPTSLDFGLLTPGTAELLGHELQVSTNASNGFIVTIQETQELTSSLGEKIHRFVDTESGLVGQATPIAWASPASTLDQYHTYGHYGITTDDARLDEVTVSTDEQFTTVVGGGYIGNFHQEPRVIFGHHGPTNAGTQDTGLVKVGVQIEIGSLQPAGDDYTNTLVYVATPTF